MLIGVFATSCDKNDELDDVDKNCIITYSTNDNQVLISHMGTVYVYI